MKLCRAPTNLGGVDAVKCEKIQQLVICVPVKCSNQVIVCEARLSFALTLESEPFVQLPSAAVKLSMNLCLSIQPTRSHFPSRFPRLCFSLVSLCLFETHPLHSRDMELPASLSAAPTGVFQDVSSCYRHLVMSQGLIMTLDYVHFPAAGIENLYERAQCIRKILLGVPRATLVVMRYLFAFLNQWVSTYTKPGPHIYDNCPFLFFPSWVGRCLSCSEKGSKCTLV